LNLFAFPRVKVDIYGLVRFFIIQFFLKHLYEVFFSLNFYNGIVVEERDPEEVLQIHGVRIAPKAVGHWNYAFDVTPASLIDGYITEQGILKAPFAEVNYIGR